MLARIYAIDDKIHVDIRADGLLYSYEPEKVYLVKGLNEVEIPMNPGDEMLTYIYMMAYDGKAKTITLYLSPRGEEE